MAKKVIPILSILFVGIVIGFILHPFVSKYRPYVTVVLENVSDQDITEVRLTHEHGICLVENLKRGQSSTIEFVVRDGTTYTLFIEFQDGHVVNSDARYAASSDRITESISNQEINFDYQAASW